MPKSEKNSRNRTPADDHVIDDAELPIADMSPEEVAAAVRRLMRNRKKGDLDNPQGRERKVPDTD